MLNDSKIESNVATRNTTADKFGTGYRDLRGGCGKVGCDFLVPRVKLEVGYGRIGNNVFFPGSAVSGSSGQLHVMANV